MTSPNQSVHNFAPLVEAVEGSVHNVYGGTARPWGCHDCCTDGDHYMLRHDVWDAAVAARPVGERDAASCLRDVRTWLGRDLTREEKRKVRAHFGLVFCLRCVVARLGRDLRIPEDLLTREDGGPLPINRPLLYAAGLYRARGGGPYEPCTADGATRT